MPNCGLCGKSFDRKWPAQKYCSRECSLKRIAKYAAEYHARRKGAPIMKSCGACGGQFPLGKRRKYCSDKCAHEVYLKLIKGYIRKKKDLGSVVTCRVCGKELKAKGLYKYCSSECQTKSAIARRKAYYNANKKRCQEYSMNWNKKHKARRKELAKKYQRHKAGWTDEMLVFEYAGKLLFKTSRAELAQHLMSLLKTSEEKVAKHGGEQ